MVTMTQIVKTDRQPVSLQYARRITNRRVPAAGMRRYAHCGHYGELEGSATCSLYTVAPWDGSDAGTFPTSAAMAFTPID